MIKTVGVMLTICIGVPLSLCWVWLLGKRLWLFLFGALVIANLLIVKLVLGL